MRIVAANVVLADYVQDLGPGTKKNVMGIVGGIRAESLPSQALLWIFTRAHLESEPGAEHTLQIVLHAPDASEAPLATARLRFDTAAGAVDAALPVMVAPLPTLGVYTVEVRIDGIKAGITLLEVHR